MAAGVTKVEASILDKNLGVERREPLLYRAWVATDRRTGVNFGGDKFIKVRFVECRRVPEKGDRAEVKNYLIYTLSLFISILIQLVYFSCRAFNAGVSLLYQ